MLCQGRSAPLEGLAPRVGLPPAACGPDPERRNGLGQDYAEATLRKTQGLDLIVDKFTQLMHNGNVTEGVMPPASTYRRYAQWAIVERTRQGDSSRRFVTAHNFV